MGFIKWIGLFSGFAQTQSVLGAIAGFVIGSVIDSIWSGDSKPTAAQSSTETANTSAEDSRSRFLFSLMVLASHVIQADGKILHCTDLGRSLLKKVSPQIRSAVLTAKFEEKLKLVEKGDCNVNDFVADYEAFIRSELDKITDVMAAW